MTTALIDQWGLDKQPILDRPVASTEAWLIAAAAHALKGREDATAKTLRSASVTDYELQLGCDGVQRRLHIRPGPQGAITLSIDKDPAEHALLQDNFKRLGAAR